MIYDDFLSVLNINATWQKIQAVCVKTNSCHSIDGIVEVRWRCDGSLNSSWSFAVDIYGYGAVYAIRWIDRLKYDV